MKCIDNELIQKYVDGEICSDEAVRIEKHLANCPQCAKNVESQKAFADFIKRKIGHWGSQPDVIPEFAAPVSVKRKLNLKPRHYLYAVSAACAIFLIVHLFPKQQNKEKEIQLIYSFDGDFDANRTVSQQEMVIMMINSDGKVVENN